jgi:hypothetical protein
MMLLQADQTQCSATLLLVVAVAEVVVNLDMMELLGDQVVEPVVLLLAERVLQDKDLLAAVLWQAQALVAVELQA